jgi:hypothetical protein
MASNVILQIDPDDSAQPEARTLLGDPRIEKVATDRGDGATGFRVSYIGSPRGSQRVVHHLPLGRATEAATLRYDVRFEGGFVFTRGKLHGLGPADPVTGGKDDVPAGWSARFNFHEGHRAKTYVYPQDRKGRWGESEISEDFRFEPARWYAVELQVQLNSGPDASDGWVRVFIDGELILEHADLRLRGTDAGEARIQTFLFSTFHGGSDRQWAPVDENDNFITVHATFANLRITEGVGGDTL